MGKETGFRKGKTLWHYILSNVGLVALCSTLLFTVMSFSFIRSMERTEREQQLLKMQLAVEDVQKQFELLQYISIQIGNNVIYHPAFYVNNSYYQLNMIRDLEKYSGYSNISNQYFFFYQDDSWAYRSTGKIYLSAALRAAGVQNIQQAEAALSD